MFVVTAFYEPKMDKKREGRIHAAFKSCGVRWAQPGPVMLAETESGEVFPIYFSDVEWTGTEDGTETELIIHCEELGNATRLASELRACGMVVTMGSAD